MASSNAATTTITQMHTMHFNWWRETRKKRHQQQGARERKGEKERKRKKETERERKESSSEIV